jgi:hypothetical protein
MKVSQKEFEILSNTDTNQLVDDIWFLSIAPVKDRDLLDSLGRKTALLLQFHDLAQGSGRRAIANAINDLDAMIKGARAVGDPTYSSRVTSITPPYIFRSRIDTRTSNTSYSLYQRSNLTPSSKSRTMQAT